MKSKLINQFNSAFLIAGFTLLIVLYIRVTRGIDFTDEMQYYGEIKGLIETGQLFSNDLFIQQVVYILFYPAFYIFNIIFEFDGFVFFGRLLLAAVCLAVFVYTYYKFVQLSYSKIASAITALSLTFAIPYHGIFAISYNSISQALWIIFLIQFFEWKQRRALSWAALTIITAFAHPTSAVVMTLLVIARMGVESNYRKILNFAVSLLAGSLIVLPMMLYFASPQQYLESLSFSSGYGVGTAFFASKTGPFTLALIFALFGGGFIFHNCFHVFAKQFVTIGLLLTSIFIVGLGFVTGYTYKTVLLLTLLGSFFYIKILNNNNVTETIGKINWLVLCLLTYATTLGVTSGNGIGQATGAMMVGLPLLLMQAATTNFSIEDDSNLRLNFTLTFLLAILFAVLWSRSPYRESGWWRANNSITSIPAFQFIKTSNDRSNNLLQMKQAIEPLVNFKQTLFIGELPVFYLLSNIQPTTCMLYMHSLTSDKSESSLRECMSSKTPEVIIDITNANYSKDESRIKIVMNDIYNFAKYKCEFRELLFASDDVIYPKTIYYRYCHQ